MDGRQTLGNCGMSRQSTYQTPALTALQAKASSLLNPSEKISPAGSTKAAMTTTYGDLVIDGVLGDLPRHGGPHGLIATVPVVTVEVGRPGGRRGISRVVAPMHRCPPDTPGNAQAPAGEITRLESVGEYQIFGFDRRRPPHHRRTYDHHRERQEQTEWVGTDHQKRPGTNPGPAPL